MPDSPTSLLVITIHAADPILCAFRVWLAVARSHWGTWEINWAGFLTQQVPRLPSTHPGPICQLASCSTEPWQQGTTSPARLHYACQMGRELDSNSHHGVREWREIEEGGRERGGAEKGRREGSCGGRK